jgi:16S rRNA (guanine527-N7)-methyltransferase
VTFISESQTLTQACASLGLSLSAEAVASLLAYRDHLLAVNQRLNLTAVTDPQEALHKHLVDSLSAVALAPLHPNVDDLWMDIGSGGGLPGMALALACPQPKVVLVDATQKKAGFLEEASRQFGLQPRVQVLAQRAEALGQSLAWRGKASVVFFKAVGRLPELLELGLPLLKTGGLLVAYKGPKAEEEVSESQKTLKLLGGEVEAMPRYTLGWQEDQRCLVLVRKKQFTPAMYPRANGMPKNHPLVG